MLLNISLNSKIQILKNFYKALETTQGLIQSTSKEFKRQLVKFNIIDEKISPDSLIELVNDKKLTHRGLRKKA